MPQPATRHPQRMTLPSARGGRCATEGEREEFKKLGVEYAYFRSRDENNW